MGFPDNIQAKSYFDVRRIVFIDSESIISLCSSVILCVALCDSYCTESHQEDTRFQKKKLKKSQKSKPVHQNR